MLFREYKQITNRVVFDARDSIGASLLRLSGPCVAATFLWDPFLLLKDKQVGILRDIDKMFLQICFKEEDTGIRIFT